MGDPLATPLPVAVRVWAPRDPTKLTRTERRRLLRRLKREAEREHSKGRAVAARLLRLPDVWLTIDCETTLDEIQRLNFGVCRIYEGHRLRLEIIFYADDLPKINPEGFITLQRYADTHPSDAKTVFGLSHKPLTLMSRTEFMEGVFWELAYEGHAIVTGFNLPFDLTRLALRATPTREGDGFSLQIWEHPMRPRLQIRIRDNKRADIRFGKRQAYNGERGEDASFRGNFLDCRTLAYALTDRGCTLKNACREFHTEHEKLDHGPTGTVTEEEIDYCRRDVLVTAELMSKLRERFARHPIPALPTAIRSGAGIAKGYLQAAKIPPILERQPDFDRERLGQAMVGYYGGRSECHIRRWPVPVVYTDFTSMYTTVGALIGVWDCLIAEELTVEDVTKEAQVFLDGVTPEAMFDRENWKGLIGFVDILPNGSDILPVRALYSPHGNWQIGVNHFESQHPLWYPLADAITSKLLTGKAPTVLRAWRLVPHGVRVGLRDVVFNSETLVRVAEQNLFQVGIEERNRLSDKRSPEGTALKLLGNSSYGITVELNPERLGKDELAEVEVFGTKCFRTKVAKPEKAGRYCFPPLGAAITGAARLMLAVLEGLVAEAGGTYAFCDTDSMAIVATEHGGLVYCPGGPERLPDGRPAIRALSWAQVEEIRERIASLCPYDSSAVKPINLLKLEDVNQAAGQQRQLYAFAIAAKRYALFTLDADGEPTIVDAKAHGLGHLLPPDEHQQSDERNSDDETKVKPWMRELWMMLVREALGLPVTEPAWLDRPAMSRITVSQPATLKLFAEFNAGKPYADQIKPCNFLIAPHVARLGHPVGVDPEHFALIAPFETDSGRWMDLEYIDRYSGERYRVSTSIAMGIEDAARVQTYRDVLNDYRRHPEAKFNGPDGQPCRADTVGLLSRRYVRLDTLHFLGKESNDIEEREYGQVHDLGEVQTQYVDEGERRRDAVQALVEAKGVAGAARELGVNPKTVSRWLRSERLSSRLVKHRFSSFA